MAAKKGGLGRGFEALFEDNSAEDLSPQSVLSPEEAVRMQRECYEGVKAGCPTAKVATFAPDTHPVTGVIV